MTVSVQGSAGQTVVFQTRKVKGSDLETDRALLDLDDIPIPSAINTAKGYTTFSEFYNDLPDNTDIRGPEGIQGPAIDSVSLAQSVDLATVTMAFTYVKDGQSYNISTTPTFTIPAGPAGTSATVSVSGTTTLNAGSNATVGEATGSTAQNRLLTFGIPRGADGTDGVSVTGVNQPTSTTINFSLSDGTTTSTVTLPGGGGGTGTVTSVGITGSNGISVTGSPVTTSGSIALSVNAATLKSHLAIDYSSDIANTPSIPVSGTDFDPVGTDNSTNVSLVTTSYDYLSITGQAITLGAIDWSTDISNKPTIPVSGTDFDPVGTDNSTNVSLVTTSYDYLSITGQAITLNAIDWSTDISNKPTIPVSGTDFDPVGTDNSTNVSLVTTSYDYLSIAGQTITLGVIDWSTDISNKPSIPVSGTDFDPVGTDNSTNVTLNTTNYDYLSITGQAITLDQVDWSTDISNKPSIPVSGTDFDPVGTDNSTNVTLNNTSYDYLTISGQAITVGQVDWSTDISNKPTIPVSGTDFDPVGTDNSTNVSLATAANNYLSLSGQEITVGTIPYQLGGTGLTSLGSAGQVLKVNSGGTALEYGPDNTGAAGVDPVVMALALG